MVYTPETIQHLTALVKGDDSARIWLQENKFPELILVYYALEGKKEAAHELAKKKQMPLVAFVHAVQDDKRAYKWLAENQNFIWAATVGVTNNDHNAEAWLKRNNLSHYAELGRAIEIDKLSNDALGWLKVLLRMARDYFKKKRNG
jgi:hypothetical protein